MLQDCVFDLDMAWHPLDTTHGLVFSGHMSACMSIVVSCCSHLNESILFLAAVFMMMDGMMDDGWWIGYSY